MRRLFCTILMFVLLCTAALAAQFPAEDANYIRLGDLGWPIRQLCLAIGAEPSYENEMRKPCFDADAQAALEAFQRENGLAVSGVFDGETLRWLLGLPAPAGEERLVWIPMHGGEKYHRLATCSGMMEPRQMPDACAAALELLPCEICCRPAEDSAVAE